jgi:hypothetical protein
VSRKQFISRIISLVPSRPEPEREIFLRAGGAYNVTGPAAFLWFRRRNVDAVNEDQVQAEFLEWLKAARNEDISGFLEAMKAYRRGLNDAVGSDAPQVLSGEVGHYTWRKIKELAGHRAVEAQAKARSVAGGRKGSKERKQQGENIKAQVLRMAKEMLSIRVHRRLTRWEAAKRISTRIDRTPNHVDTILKGGEDAGEISFGMKGVHPERRG